MSIMHAAGVRNNLANVTGDAHDVGAGTAVLELRDGADIIVSFPLPNPAFDTAPATAAGTITLLGVPIEVQAIDASAAVDNFVTRDRAGTIVLSGSVTAVGMGGDIEVTNPNIATGQDCSLESLTYTAAL